MSETAVIENLQSPTVFFIDDSATMREVMKIAFRRENIGVVACHDANDALVQIEESMPDVVITDVIMPDKDGYEVCQFVKEHAEWGKTPVILMSGVVNRSVAERATAVKADELIRKPFQPQDLLARVKKLLNPASALVEVPSASPEMPAAANPLSSVFAQPPRSVSSSLAGRSAAPPRPAPRAPAPGAAPSAELQMLRGELKRFELLVKKLQSELEAERQYNAALEAQIKALQGVG